MDRFQFEQQSEGYMNSWKGTLIIIYLGNVSSFTKASRPLEMFDVADNTKPRRLIMPRATSREPSLRAEQRSLGGRVARVGRSEVAELHFGCQTTTTTFCVHHCNRICLLGRWAEAVLDGIF